MKDLDFMHAADQPQQLIASVGGDGNCTIWQLAVQQGSRQAEAQQITQLEPPKSEQHLLCCVCWGHVPLLRASCWAWCLF